MCIDIKKYLIYDCCCWLSHFAPVMVFLFQKNVISFLASNDLDGSLYLKNDHVKAPVCGDLLVFD